MTLKTKTKVNHALPGRTPMDVALVSRQWTELTGKNGLPSMLVTGGTKVKCLSDIAHYAFLFLLAVGLGYHRDPQTRAAFMEVLTKILQQGTEFETLAETVLADRFERLVELVTMIGDKGELPIAMALASVVANPHMVWG